VPPKKGGRGTEIPPALQLFGIEQVWDPSRGPPDALPPPLGAVKIPPDLVVTAQMLTTGHVAGCRAQVYGAEAYIVVNI